VFYLPVLVRERTPAVIATVAPSPVAPPVATEPAAAVPQDEIDEALGAFLRQDDELRKLNAERWAGEEWTKLRRLAEEGDAAYRRRESAATLDLYRQAGATAGQLLARAPVVLEEALREGRKALAAGDETAAQARFEMALAIDAGHVEARRGLERAKNLPALRALLTRATSAEAAGNTTADRNVALGFYRQAATLDPESAEAVAGVARLQGGLAADAFATQMARGFAAQARGDFEAAADAFSAALRVRPGDAQAQSALTQLQADQQLARLVGLQQQAGALEKEERWNEALSRYESVLAVDPALVTAQEGAARARTRLDLDRRMRTEITSADRFNDDAVLARARSTLAAARAIADAGPVLAAQVVELGRLLELAVIPVTVRFDSDNLTEVTIYKVGRLGMFSSRSLELRPGLYTVVGSRAGYRDVRRNVRVEPGREGLSVSVRCEEPI
jgi:eukaryotic-like serine/threonine-protein kinase